MTDQPSTTAGDLLHTVQGGVKVPFLRAVAAGFLFSLPVLVICAGIAVNYEPFRRWWWLVWLTALTGFQSWWWWRDEQRRGRMLDAIERVLLMDIDGDGDIGGEPQEENIIVTAERMTENNYIQAERGRIPVSYAQAKAFAIAVLAGEGTDYRTWCRDKKLFSETEFADWREYLERLHAVESRGRGDTSGVVVTANGRNVLQAIIDYAPHSPTE